MKIFIALVMLSFPAFAQAFVAPNRHQTCQAVLSVGGNGRYAMNSKYALDMDGYKQAVSKALERKGYQVVQALNYNQESAFGSEGIQQAQGKKALAIEFRIAAPVYELANREEHRCAVALKIIDPRSERRHEVRDAKGNLVGSFKTFPALYSQDFESEVSSLVSLRHQCQRVFDALINSMPVCEIE